ncbi:hypothetical protein OSB04_009966 [Centaurea solstitialis]|nr:hypothetical protein OSB04_009966 [Centaurea solstitialis]
MIRTTMETLAADEHIYTNVIDGWVDVLNMEEQYRSPESPHRLFFTPSVLVGGVLLRHTYGFSQRYEMFRSNLLSEAKNSDDIFNIRSFDMVFFPILQGVHYFCVVFNFKKNTIDILDNIERHVNVDAYDNAITDLKNLFVHHLEQVQHPSAEMLKQVEVRLLEMKWRTKENYIDCGVFLMRHMETYMGGGLRGWFTGLTTESETQKKQLQMLRIKYTGKILLGEYNLNKDDIVEQMDALNKLGDEGKAKKLDEASKTRKERLLKY